MKSSKSSFSYNILPYPSKQKGVNELLTESESDNEQTPFIQVKSTSCDSITLHSQKRKRNDNTSTKELTKFFYIVLAWINYCIKVDDKNESLDIILTRKECKYKKVWEGKKILNNSIENFLLTIKKSKKGKDLKNIDTKVENVIQKLDVSLKQLKLVTVFEAFISEGICNTNDINVGKEYLDGFNKIKSNISSEQKEKFKMFIQYRYIDGKIKGRRSKSTQKIVIFKCYK